MIAILIKTTPNRKSLKWLLASIDLSIPENEYRIYLADEEPIDEWKKPIYSELERNGHYVIIYKNRTSVTLARNQLINELMNEDFVLRVDDDFELGGEFNLSSLLNVLSHPNIHFCTDIERQIGNGRTKSGSLRISNGLIHAKPNKQPIIYMLNDYEWKYSVINNTRYAYADYMRNLILLKRECFDYVKWNENLFFSGEHLDFYLRLNKIGLQGAFTPDSIHLHREDIKRETINYQAENTWRRNDQNTIKRTIFEHEWNGHPIYKSSIISKLYNCYHIFKL